MTPAPYGFPPYDPVPTSDSYSKSRHAVLNYLRLLNYVGRLVEKVSGPKTGMDEADDEFRPHDVTYLKLLLAWSYARRFMNYGRRATAWYYIDLLSASGLSYTRNQPDDPVPGSCFLVPLAMQEFEKPAVDLGRTFDKVFCFDKDANALAKIEERRRGLIRQYGFDLPEFGYADGDANQSIEIALKEIETAGSKPPPPGKLRPLTLVFVDNLSLDIEMDTIKRIQKRIRADLIIHLPTRAIWRCIEAFRKSGREQHKLTAFFGTDQWKQISAMAEIPDFYHELVRAATGHKLQDFDPVPIQGARSDFHLCIYVRHTAGTEGKEGWLATIRSLAKECAGITHETIQAVREISSGKQRTLF